VKRPRPCARTATCTVSTLAAGRQHAADRGMKTARDEAHWVHARPGRGRLSASCTPTLRTEIVRERWRASRLPSLRSALRGLDPHHALPVSWHLSERRPVLSHGLDEVEGLHHRQATRNRRHDAPIMMAEAFGAARHVASATSPFRVVGTGLLLMSRVRYRQHSRTSVPPMKRSAGCTTLRHSRDPHLESPTITSNSTG
jgi:hypothetical protein